MSLLTAFNLATLILTFGALALLLLVWSKYPFRESKITLLLLLVLITFNTISNYLEWAKITAYLDVYEDFIDVITPLLWIFVFYSFIQNHLNKQIREREAYYRSLINDLREDIVIIDRNLNIIDINNSVLATLKLTREEVIGKSYLALFSLNQDAEQQKQFLNAFNHTMQTGQLTNCQLNN